MAVGLCLLITITLAQTLPPQGEQIIRPGYGECPAVEGARKNVAPGQCEKRYDPLADVRLPIAMAYVPWQKWRDVMKPHDAIRRGTIFEELSLPFYGKGGCNR